MGNGKWDTCENCINCTGKKDDDGQYICKLDKRAERKQWCKRHESEEEIQEKNKKR